MQDDQAVWVCVIFMRVCMCVCVCVCVCEVSVRGAYIHTGGTSM